MRLLAWIGLSFALVACSGASTPFLTGGADGGQDGGGGGDGGGASEGGTDGGGGGPDAAVDCNALAAQLGALETQATKCCATCNIVQCTHAVDGLCCPIGVNEPNSKAVKDYEAALAVYKAACPSACPAISCVKEPSGVCDQTGQCQ